MIEVRKETIFQKLKTEILPLSQDQFTDFIHEIILRSTEGSDQSVAIRILSECFDDEIEIQQLINKSFYISIALGMEKIEKSGLFFPVDQPYIFHPF